VGYECYRFFHINGLRIRKITKGTFIGAKIINQNNTKRRAIKTAFQNQHHQTDKTQAKKSGLSTK
jgi:hypothetical protein